LTALTGPSPFSTAHQRSSGPSLTAGCVVLRLNRYYGRLRRPSGQRSTSRFHPVIGRHAPVTNSAGHRAGEGLPSSRRHYRYVPRPLRRGVPHGCASRLYTASLAFTPMSRGSALPCPRPTGQVSLRRRRLRVMLRTASSLPLAGLLTLGSDPARFQARPPACYRASWQLPGPDFHRQAATSLRTQETPWH
jgi:hypothetical protein